MKRQILIGVGVFFSLTALYGQNKVEYGGAVFQFAATAGTEGNLRGFEGLGGNVVVGKPFSATEERHSLQILGDGTRLENTETNLLYRDEQGRTRIERSDGTATIFDPVAGFAVELLPNEKIAVKRYEAVLDAAARLAKLREELSQKSALSADNSPQAQEIRSQMLELQTAQARDSSAAQQDKARAEALARQRTPPGAQRTISVATPGGPVTVVFSARAGDNASVDDLPSRMMDGALAQGTRTTETIPVGKIGNDRPIVVVNERWFSPDLQILVKSSSSDPRFGDTTYQLTNIVQASPDPSLFRIPGDYRIRK